MKKIFTLFVLMLVVLGVQAKTDKYACNQTLETTYSWTDSNKEICLFNDISTVDKSKYKYLHIKFSNKVNISYMQVRIMCNGNYSTASWHTDYYSSSDITIDLSEQTYKDENATATVRSLSDISRMYLRAFSTDNTKEASFDISQADIYLESEEYECMGITTTIDSKSDKDTPFAWSATGTLSTISNNLGKTNSGTIFGYGNNNDLDHGSFDVTGYDKVKVTLGAAVSDSYNKSIRLLKGEGTSNVEFSATAGTTIYEAALTLTKCTSIKAGAGASNCQHVSTIDFIKDFKPTSTTAFNIAASSSSTINYDRQFTAGQKSTVCLPFALDEEEVSKAGKFYTLSSVADGNLTFTEVTETEAYKPYIFVPNGTGTVTPFSNLTNKEIAATAANNTEVEGFTFTGTLNATTDAASLGTTVFGWSSEDGSFKKAGEGVSINAFRAVIVTSQSLARSLRAVFDDEITEINEVKTQKKVEDGVMYNLSGQRVDASYKGIVVKNGKKYYNK